MGKGERRIEALEKMGWTVTEDRFEHGFRSVELEKVTNRLVRGEGGVTVVTNAEEYHRKDITIYNDGTFEEATR